MSNKIIDYDKIISNIDEMINVHEFDGMRSPGKIRVSAETLVALYALKDRYSKPKPTPKKEVK